MKRSVAVIAAFASAAIYLAVAVIAIGGAGAFFTHPALTATAIVFFLFTIAAMFAGGNVSPGVREDRSNRWVLMPVIAIGLAAAFVAPWTDRIGLWTIDGEATRWLGVALLAVGGALRVAPVFVLGHRFSGLVAIQPGHTLVTTGIYARIRNPSYLGMLVGALGWALAFRSAIGVLLALLLVPPLIARMNSEEALLASEFGVQYEAYRAKTRRLIPGVY
ncbi:MAG: isoprenylcysteine carboxylmethyltransferase family protein [Candidatus Eremiobacteraeota bacterium]|nr:isoprenylcysteine carboxylmethyltransferase family protein [Candidatus Eremiobacteraeota bacterium]MBV8498938.1 isoprenylcysteine carboxylmethyltransferase family protein [Candidatus Eremiobacteraeota bacterium]